MTRPDVLLARVANRHGGAFHTDHARESGMTRAMVHHRHQTGIIVPMHPNVWRFAAAPFTQQTRQHGALLACGPDSMLSHRSAAAVHGFPALRRFRPEVTTPHLDLPRIPGIEIHRTRHLRPAEIRVVDGLRVTSKGRTALGLCEVLPFARAEAIITEAVITKVLTIADLLGGIELGGGRGVTGTVACRAIAMGALDLEGLQSVLELAVARIVQAARVPRPVRQHELVCADGREVTLDNAWPDVKLAVEADGLRWHATPARLRRSQARSRSIQGSGWVHLVFGWYDAHEGAAGSGHEIEWHHDHLARRRHAA